MISLHSLLRPQLGLLTGETDSRKVGEAPIDAASSTHTHCTAIQLQSYTTPRAHAQLCTPLGLHAPNPSTITEGLIRYMCKHSTQPDIPGISIHEHSSTQTDRQTMHTRVIYSHTQRDADHVRTHTARNSRHEYTGRWP